MAVGHVRSQREMNGHVGLSYWEILQSCPSEDGKGILVEKNTFVIDGVIIPCTTEFDVHGMRVRTLIGTYGQALSLRSNRKKEKEKGEAANNCQPISLPQLSH